MAAAAPGLGTFGTGKATGLGLGGGSGGLKLGRLAVAASGSGMLDIDKAPKVERGGF